MQRQVHLPRCPTPLLPIQCKTEIQCCKAILQCNISTVYCDTLFQRYTAMQSCPLVMHLLLTLHWLLWPRTVLVCGVYMFLFHGMLFGTLYIFYSLVRCIALHQVAMHCVWQPLAMHQPNALPHLPQYHPLSLYTAIMCPPMAKPSKIVHLISN